MRWKFCVVLESALFKCRGMHLLVACEPSETTKSISSSSGLLVSGVERPTQGQLMRLAVRVLIDHNLLKLHCAPNTIQWSRRDAFRWRTKIAGFFVGSMRCSYGTCNCKHLIVLYSPIHIDILSICYECLSPENRYLMLPKA